MTNEDSCTGFPRESAADMLPTMNNDRKKRPRIAVVGAGKLGTALAVSLHAAGYAISEIVSRNRKSSERKAMVLSKRVGGSVARGGKATLRADVVWRMRNRALRKGRGGAQQSQERARATELSPGDPEPERHSLY